MPIQSLNYFDQPSVNDGTEVGSTINASALITKIHSVYPTDTYLDSTDKLGMVYVYYTHEDGRQQKRVVHDIDSHRASVSWSTYARTGTWLKDRIKAFDKDGAFLVLNRTDIGSSEDLIHAPGVTYLNVS